MEHTKLETVCILNLSETGLLARLESAYSLIWGAHRIWGQDLGTFMISRLVEI